MIETDHIVEVGHHLCQTFNDFVDRLHEAAGRSTAALRYEEPLVEARGSKQIAVIGTVSLCAVIIWWSEETKSKKKNTSSLPQGVEDLVHARNRQLTEAADLVEFLVVHGDPNASRLLRDDPPTCSSPERSSAGSGLPQGTDPRWPPLPWPGWD